MNYKHETNTLIIYKRLMTLESNVPLLLQCVYADKDILLIYTGDNG